MENRTQAGTAQTNLGVGAHPQAPISKPPLPQPPNPSPNLLLGQIHADKYQRTLALFLRQPLPIPVGVIQALHALEQQAARLVFDRQYAFVAQQVVGVFQQQAFHHVGDLHQRQRALQRHYDRADVALRLWDAAEQRGGRRQVELVVQRKAFDVEQHAQIDIAVRHLVDRRARVHPLQSLDQRLAVRRHVGFGQQKAVGVAHLRLGDAELAQLLLGVCRVHQGDDAVQQEALAQDLVREKGLGNRAGIGHAGAFDDQPVERQLAAVDAVQQIQQRVCQFVGLAAADAAVAQRGDAAGAIADQRVVDRHFAELVLDDRDFIAVFGVQDVAQQGGFAGAQKAGQDGDCNGFHTGPCDCGLTAAHAAFAVAAVARLLALAEKFFIGHHRLVRVVVFHVLDVGIVVRHAHQHARRLPEIFPRLAEISEHKPSPTLPCITTALV